MDSDYINITLICTDYTAENHFIATYTHIIVYNYIILHTNYLVLLIDPCIHAKVKYEYLITFTVSGAVFQLHLICQRLRVRRDFCFEQKKMFNIYQPKMYVLNTGVICFYAIVWKLAINVG